MRALALIVVLLAGCLRQTEFRCDDDSACSGGRCEAQGYCSFFDPSCEGTQQRFGESAGSLSNTCVGTGSTGDDAGVDTPPVGNCPSGYAEVPNATPGRVYRLLADPDDWLEQANACAATAPGRAYLVIPDDAAELQAIREGLAQGPYWVGIDDRTNEGTFLNAKLELQQFLPWAPGEPDNNMGGQDCVEALDGTQIATLKCNQELPAVCECEP